MIFHLFSNNGRPRDVAIRSAVHHFVPVKVCSRPCQYINDERCGGSVAQQGRHFHKKALNHHSLGVHKSANSTEDEIEQVTKRPSKVQWRGLPNRKLKISTIESLESCPLSRRDIKRSRQANEGIRFRGWLSQTCLMPHNQIPHPIERQWSTEIIFEDILMDDDGDHCTDGDRWWRSWQSEKTEIANDLSVHGSILVGCTDTGISLQLESNATSTFTSFK